MIDKSDTLNMLSASMDSNLSIKPSSADSVMTIGGAWDTSGGATMTGWTYWTDYYYPHVIRESYPVYVQEKAKDKGKQAFEIVKILKDKKLVNLTKVGDFIDLMDELIKIL